MEVAPKPRRVQGLQDNLGRWLAWGYGEARVRRLSPEQEASDVDNGPNDVTVGRHN
jgi:hypothetical protein